MSGPCSYIRQNGSALPPDLTPALPPGSAQLPSRGPKWRERIRWENFDTAKIVVNTSGDALAAAAAAAGQSSAFPQAFLNQQLIFPSAPVGVIAFSLAVSITSVAAGVVGLFAFKSNQNAIAIATGPMPLSIFDVVTQANSLAGIPNPAVRNVQFILTDKTAMRFNPNEPLSVYLSAPNDAATLITATLTAYYITLNA